MTRRERDLRRLVAREVQGRDLKVRFARTGSDHHRIEVETPDGRAAAISASCSPSDHRDLENTRRNLRRALRSLESPS